VSLAYACIDEERDPNFVVRFIGVKAPDCTSESVLVGMMRISDVWFRFVVRGQLDRCRWMPSDWFLLGKWVCSWLIVVLLEVVVGLVHILMYCKVTEHFEGACLRGMFGRRVWKARSRGMVERYG
jgi:hypothetical protein